ncbi:MAG: sulfatase-like hydrolase/transferase [Planctomycetota bacterium]
MSGGAPAPPASSSGDRPPRQGLRLALLVLPLLFFCLVLPLVGAAMGYFAWRPFLEEEPGEGSGGPRELGGGHTVVLIAIDDLRRDHLAQAGYPLDPAPRLTELGQEGVLLADYLPASVAVSPGLASLLTGLPPWEHGLLSAREVGAHRLPAAVETVAEAYSTRGWTTLGSVSLHALGERLSGLHQGFEVWREPSPKAGYPRSAEAVLAALDPELERLLDVGSDLFVFLHFGDLRGRSDGTEFLRAHLEPFRADSSEVAGALDQLSLDPDGARAALDRAIGRRRGKPEWLALQRAYYDAQLAAVDRAVGAVVDRVRTAGRAAPLIVVAGTRGRYLEEGRPPGGAPEPFSEELLATPALVVGAHRPPDAAEPYGAAGLGALLAREGLGATRTPQPDGAGGAPAGRLVAGPGLAEFALVGEAHKLLQRVGDPASRRVFERTTDREVDPGSWSPVRELPAILLEGFGWSATVEATAEEALSIRLRSPRKELGRATAEGAELSVSPSGAAVEGLWTGAGALEVACRTRTAPLVLELAVEEGPAGLLEVWSDHTTLLGGVLPCFPSAPGDGAESVRPVRLERDGPWTRVQVDAPEGAEVWAELWAYPPDATAAPPAVEGGAGVLAVSRFAGLDAVAVEGRGDLSFRVRLRAGQRAAVAVRVGGVVLPPHSLSAEGGGEQAGLELLLPGTEADRLQLGDRLELRRRYSGPTMEPPLDLTEGDLRLLNRLGPLE